MLSRVTKHVPDMIDNASLLTTTPVAEIPGSSSTATPQTATLSRLFTAVPTRCVDGRIRKVKQCWGCNEGHQEQDVYCKTCQVSLKLLRLLEDHGTVIYWNIPEQKLYFEKSR